MNGTIGIAIATFNSAETIEFCLEPLAGAGFVIVLFDDGSDDDTVARATEICPDIHVLQGDGQNWWAGSTQRAMEKCIELNCEYVLMLNPDVRLSAEGVTSLVRHAADHPRTIPAAVVVERGREEHIAWAGSRYRKVGGCLPVYTSKYIAKRGSSVATLGDEPYSTDEVHGRGVLVSREIIEEIGLLDGTTFPHYGADNDYSWRARRASIDMVILPDVRAAVEVSQTGMKPAREVTIQQRLKTARDYLLERKNGEALGVTFKLYRRHLPWYAFPGTFLLHIGLNLYRRLV